MVLGNALIWISLVLTGLAMGLYLPGVKQGRRTPFLRQARWAVYGAAVGMVLTLGYLWYLFLTHQFQFDYVHAYSSRDMQLRYVISALWGGQEGTFLLWAGFAGLLAVFLRFKAKTYEPAVQFFYMGITLFLLLMLTKASPFKLLDIVPQDGRGLNPLLQDPWMTIHPPITFFGFASLGIAAAYAMAALIKEDWDAWVPRALPWTVFGVVSLGVGLTLGGYWSYSILGWGGYWGWDPVENSSLVPWLFGIALIHTQLIQVRQGRFRRINLVLSMLPFILLTYSTFLTRSGVLADFSVHSFTDLGINQFLVAFIGIFLGGGVLLFLNKMSRVPVTKQETASTSRESLLFWGSAAFALFGLMVCLGTSAPLLTRVFGTPANVQPEFYNRVGLPFIIIVSILMGFGPHLIWNQTSGRELWWRLRTPLFGTLAAVVIALVAGIRQWQFVLMLLSAAFALFANLAILFSLARWRLLATGGALSHAGIGLMAVGILTSTAYDQQKLVELPKGKNIEAFGYTLRYLGRRPVENGRKQAYDISISKDAAIHVVSPLMYFNDMNASTMKKPAIQSFLTHDVYIAPGGLDIETVADRTAVSVALKKMEIQPINGMTVQFEKFEMPGAESPGDGQSHTSSSESHAMEFRAVVHITVGNTEHTLRPAMVKGSNGIQPGPALSIPGTESAMRLEGIDASNGRIRVSVGYPPLALDQHTTGELKGYQVHFDGFDIAMTGNNEATVTGIVQLTGPDGEVMSLTPGFIDRKDQEREYVESRIASSGLNLVMTSVDTHTGRGEFQITRPPSETVWVEASIKPLIILLWLGTGLLTLGMVLSTVYRGRLSSRTRAKTLSLLDKKRGVA